MVTLTHFEISSLANWDLWPAVQNINKKVAKLDNNFFLQQTKKIPIFLSLCKVNQDCTLNKKEAEKDGRWTDIGGRGGGGTLMPIAQSCSSIVPEAFLSI